MTDDGLVEQAKFDALEKSAGQDPRDVHPPDLRFVLRSF
jgi:hypothetical protein